MINKIRQIPFLICLIHISFLSPGQEQFINLHGIIDAESDKQGNIYVALENGNIVKFDSSGQQLNSITLRPGFGPDQLDVSGNFRIYLFYSSDQQYFLLDRHFKILTENQFGNVLSDFISLSAYDRDQNIWIYSETDVRLKKNNPLTNNILADVNLNLLFPNKPIEITGIESFQNRIYLNNSGSDIYVFDSFGNFQKSIPVATNDKISFFKDEIFYTQQQNLMAVNLYTGETRLLSKSIPDPERFIKLIVHTNYQLLVYRNKIVKDIHKDIRHR